MAELQASAVPVAEGLFTWPSEVPALIASRCGECEQLVFPAARRCLCCGSEDMAEVLLSRSGILYTWTTQGFRPPSPPYVGTLDFVPFAIGYIELAEGIRVEARLTETEPAQLSIGSTMELRIVPAWRRDDGVDVLTFAFAPVKAAQ